MTQNDLDFEISFFSRLVYQNPDYIEALIALAECYTKKGLYSKGLRIDKRLSKLCHDDPIIYYNLACSYALTKKNNEAFRALLRSIKLGYSDFAHLQRDRDLKNLHNDPRFKKLISLISD